MIPALCNVALALILYFAEKKMQLDKLDDRLKQGVIGILFSALAAFSTEYGVDVGGATMNAANPLRLLPMTNP